MGYKNIDSILANVKGKGTLVKLDFKNLKKYSRNTIRASVSKRETEVKKVVREEKRNIESLKWTFSKYKKMSVQEPSQVFLPNDVITINREYLDVLSNKKIALNRQQENIREAFSSVHFYINREMQKLENDFNSLKSEFLNEGEIKK